jgi:C1A family cysteine protease
MDFLNIFRAKPDFNRHGWKPDLPDHRDLAFVPKLSVAVASVDLSPKCPAIYDQGELGSCTANAIAGAMEFDQLKENKAWDFKPSRLFIYYNERVIEGTVSQDSGAQIRDGIKSVNQSGVCKETLCPYVISKFTKKPSAACYAEALYHKSVSYQRLDNTKIDDLRTCLSAGSPFIFGFTVYDYFESAQMDKSGILTMPGTNESPIGGHAVLCVGYDDAKQMFLVRNSWGAGWGLKGYFWMPYAYMTNPNLATDFWTITTINSSKY